MKNVSVYIGAVAIMEFEKKEFIFVPDLPSYVPGIISTNQSYPDVRTDGLRQIRVVNRILQFSLEFNSSTDWYEKALLK